MNKTLLTLTLPLFSVCLIAGCTTLQEGQTAREAALVEAFNEADQRSEYDDDYDPDEIICKTRKQTGSRIGGVKDCRTAENWRRSTGNANRAIETWKNDSSAVWEDDQ